MKVSTIEPEIKPIKPVQIVLETQEEVDKVYALFCNSKIADVLLIGTCNNSDPWWKKLEEYKTSNGADKWHQIIKDLIEGK